MVAFAGSSATIIFLWVNHFCQKKSYFFPFPLSLLFIHPTSFLAQFKFFDKLCACDFCNIVLYTI